MPYLSQQQQQEVNVSHLEKTTTTTTTTTKAAAQDAYESIVREHERYVTIFVSNMRKIEYNRE